MVTECMAGIVHYIISFFLWFNYSQVSLCIFLLSGLFLEAPFPIWRVILENRIIVTLNSNINGTTFVCVRFITLKGKLRKLF